MISIENPQPHWRYDIIAIGLFSAVFLHDPKMDTDVLVGYVPLLLKFIDRAGEPVLRTLGYLHPVVLLQ